MLITGWHPWKEAGQLEECPLLLQLGALAVVRLFWRIQVICKCHLKTAVASLLLFTVEMHERKWGVTSKSLDVAEKRFLFFFFRSALFPWQPFVKIPAVGITLILWVPEDAQRWDGLVSGRIFAQTISACFLGSANPSFSPIILKKAVSPFFLCLPNPPADFLHLRDALP